MEKFNTDGIVIKTGATGESDLIVWILTRTRGIIRAFAKGARGVKSRLHSGSSLFSYCIFEFYEKNGVYHVTDADVQNIFFALREDIVRMSLGQYFCEILLKTIAESEPDESYLRLMLNSLYFLSENKKPALQVKAVFELRIAVLAGYAPPIHSCAECGEYQTDPMYFNCMTGELFCSSCGDSREVPAVSAAVIAAMRHIVFSPFDKIFAFQIHSDLLRILSLLTEKYLQNCLQQTFRLLDYVHAVI